MDRAFATPTVDLGSTRGRDKELILLLAFEEKYLRSTFSNDKYSVISSSCWLANEQVGA